MTETVEQMKEMRAIEHFQIAIGDLYKQNTSPIVINTMAALLQEMMEEYKEKYPPEERKE